MIAVAKLPASIKVNAPPERRFFGVVTWTRIREIDWADAPLEVRQLHRLLDTTEVVMAKVTKSALEGMLASWNTWDALQAWSRKGTEAVQVVLSQGGFKCVQQDRARQHVKVDMTHGRLVWWMWPTPWNEDSLAIYAGLFMGRPNVPVTHSNLPDMILALHINPESPRGIRLCTDATLTSAAERWTSRPSDGVTRELRPSPDAWEILRCRASSQELADADDPGMHMIRWMEARAQEWVVDGIAARLSMLV